MIVEGTTPYPWPWDGVLDPARLALVVAGHDPAWVTRCLGTGPVGDALTALGARVLDLGGAVVCVGGKATGEPTPDGLARDPRCSSLRAAGIDAFYGSHLDHLLRREGRDHLLVGGYGLEAPVHSTLRSANDRGYECLLLVDASAHLHEETRGPARSMVEMSGGIFGAVGTASAVLDALAAPGPVATSRSSSPVTAAETRPEPLTT